MDGNIHIATQAELLERGIKATGRYLELNGETVLDAAYETPAGRIDLVTRDANDVVRFVMVRVRRSMLPDMMKIGDEERGVLEMRASTWLEAHRDAVDCAISFDIVDLAIIGNGNDRAIMRVARDALAGSCPYTTGNDLLARAELRAATVPDGAVELDIDDDAEEPAERPAEDIAAESVDES
ncbi:Uncharacterised protein family UPF0102 [Slackia heliotrinireducens]|uniref:Uncharacterized protein family UPF0102 n=1 Tax=Slackia heliotrinireducens (strain ATCC 29202 / DSM 20476 / NCTC 11029 / RHS 1) TaxID=471855 RepID=C7N826_SLAHD|nr:YraN family protein [Slackia heliotrinireducens]ACV23061.1 Uncharacterized protein family UPF0102 [Slackia heliotrinireducens DSM 20476]VEH02013.1 Uncharacterised protein family UPF0102 [Slackia heliotrinireducens]